MSQAPIHSRRIYTEEEYFALEEKSETRHEFHDGEIIAMAGGSAMHSRIISNIIRELGNRLRGGPCGMFDSNLRLRIEQYRKNVYPDAVVVCGDLQYYERDKSKGTILNPRVVVEVLSPSTERKDRTEKVAFYQSVPSVDTYLMVEQHLPHITILTKRTDGSWSFDHAGGMAGAIKLQTLGIDLPLAEVYERVEFPEAEQT